MWMIKQMGFSWLHLKRGGSGIRRDRECEMRGAGLKMHRCGKTHEMYLSLGRGVDSRMYFMFVLVARVCRTGKRSGASKQH